MYERRLFFILKLLGHPSLIIAYIIKLHHDPMVVKLRTCITHVHDLRAGNEDSQEEKASSYKKAICRTLCSQEIVMKIDRRWST